jgi:hypothetical protein
MVDAKTNTTVRDMSAKQRAGQQKVENDAPTGNLRVVIAA